MPGIGDIADLADIGRLQRGENIVPPIGGGGRLPPTAPPSPPRPGPPPPIHDRKRGSPDKSGDGEFFQAVSYRSGSEPKARPASRPRPNDDSAIRGRITMKKPFPDFKTDAAAERSVAEADLTEYALSR